jgi:putative PIN family toxin of toxin-antitoxin system
VRIVLDTNVLVSGLLNPHGPPGRILDLITSGLVRVLYDDRIIAEYREVLARPRFGFDPDDVETLLEFIASEGESVISAPLALVLPDPDDLPFLEVAVAGRADALVTGNTDHFVPSAGEHHAEVCLPAVFISKWKAGAET